MAEETQTAAPAGSATETSTAATSNAGPNQPQPANAGVDNGSAEDKGNSAASDGQNGADGGDAGRQRPGRAERRISELLEQNKKLQSAIDSQASVSSQLQKTPVDTSQVNLPDYSQMTEITPEQIKKDVVAAASQIVDLKMQTTANALETKMTLKQSAKENANAIVDAQSKYAVLNPDSEDYDPQLESEISSSYAEILQRDPSYSFAKFIKPMERFLAQQSKSSESTTTTEASSRGTSANRAGGQSRSQKAFEDMSTTEMEAYFASKRK